MRALFVVLGLLLVPANASAATYVATATNLVMHVGDPLPPLIFSLSTYPGTYASNFKGQPALTTAATSSSPVGSYPIDIAAGTMATVSANDSLTYVAGTLTVIPQDSIGAQLTTGVTYPPGLFDGPTFPVINVKANPIANLVGDGVTDDTPALQALLAFGRDAWETNVETNGTTVVGTSGTSFYGLTGAVQINGLIYTVASIADAGLLTLTASAGVQTGVKLQPEGDTVNTQFTSVSVTSGPALTQLTDGGQVLINGIHYSVLGIADAGHLTLTSDAGVQSGVQLYSGSQAQGFGRQSRYLYFPPGIYRVSQQLAIYGNYLTLFGSGPNQSVIRLDPSIPTFNGTQPQPFLSYAAISNGFNDQFQEYIYDLGIDIGPGNPQVEIVKWVANNYGEVHDVVMWAEDSSCYRGLSLQHAYSGPSMVKDLAIYGCVYGVQAGQPEYSTTIEGLTTEGQTLQGINSAGYHLSMRHWLSANAVSAFAGLDNGTSSAVLDSELIYTGSSTVTGITEASGGIFYGRNISCTGYDPCEIDTGTGTAMSHGALPFEFWTGPALSIFDLDRPAGSLNLPIQETPRCPASLPSDATELGPDPSTWAAAVSASTSPVVYLPPGAYHATASVDLDVPDTVDCLQFWSSEFDGRSSSYAVNVNVAGSSSTPLALDGFQANNLHVSHTGTRTVSVLNSAVAYQSVPDAGNVFFEDDGIASWIGSIDGAQDTGGDGPTFYASQSVWGRQFDDEIGTFDGGPQVRVKYRCDGCTLWLLGEKTEQDSADAILTNQARGELMGFFFYNLHKSPTEAGASPIYLSDSSLFATGFLYVNQPSGAPPYGDDNWVNETQGGDAGVLPTPSALSSELLSAFYSYGASDGGVGSAATSGTSGSTSSGQSSAASTSTGTSSTGTSSSTTGGASTSATSRGTGTTTAGPVDAPSSGCSCTAGGSDLGSLLLLGIAVAFARRRCKPGTAR